MPYALNALTEKNGRIPCQAALAVTNAWQGSCRSKLYEELGWESSGRNWCRHIVSDKSPSYFKNKLSRLRRPLYRQALYIVTPFTKLLRHTSSFFPDEITSWNNVITHFNDIPSFSVLKTIFYL